MFGKVQRRVRDALLRDDSSWSSTAPGEAEAAMLLDDRRRRALYLEARGRAAQRSADAFRSNGCRPRDVVVECAGRPDANRVRMGGRLTLRDTESSDDVVSGAGECLSSHRSR